MLVTTNNFDGVDIYRGVNNPSVNSYNSLGGTINYKPIEPTDTKSGEAGVSYGSFNSYSYHATLNTGSYHGLDQLFSFRRDFSTGWLNYSKDQNDNFYYALTAPNLNGRGEAYLNFIYDHNQGQTPHTVPLPLIAQYGKTYQFPASYGNSNNLDTDMLLIAGEKYSVNNIMTINLKGFFGHNSYERTSYANPLYLQSAAQPYSLPNTPSSSAFWTSNPFYPSYDPAAAFGSVEYGTDYHLYGQRASELGLQPSVRFNLPHNLVEIGGNLTYGSLNSHEYWYGSQPVPQILGYDDAWNEPGFRTLGSVYAQDTIKLLDDRLTLTPGVKYLHADTKDYNATGFYDQPGSDSDQEHYISPTIGANLTLFKRAALYFAYGKNVKFPDISAYYGNIGQFSASGANVTPPLAVKPEYVNDYEAGVRYEHHGFQGEIGAYRELFSNTFITVTNPATLVSTQTNGGSSRYQGVELQLKQDFGALLGAVMPGDFRGYFNYAFNQALFTSSFNSDYAGTVLTGQPVANVPQNLLSGGVTYDYDNWHVDANAHYVGAQYLQQAFAGTPTAYTESPYFLLNIAIAKTIPLHLGQAHALRIGLNIDNLLNRTYYTNDYINQDYSGNNYNSVLIGAPRAFYGSLTLLF